MEAEKKQFELHTTAKSLSYSDPLVIGVGSLILGYAIGSGRLRWLGSTTGRIASGLGSMALNYFYHSVQNQNPQLFASRDRVTH